MLFETSFHICGKACVITFVFNALENVYVIHRILSSYALLHVNYRELRRALLRLRLTIYACTSKLSLISFRRVKKRGPTDDQ